MRWRSMLAAAVAAAGLTAVVPAHAQTVQDALKVVPRDAMAFVVISHINEADARLSDLAEQLKLPLPGSVLKLAKAQLGISKGLNDEGTALVALIPDPDLDSEPVGVFFVPTTDYKALLQELKAKNPDAEITEFQPPKGPAMLIARKGPFAAIGKADQKEAFEKALKSAGGGKGAGRLQAWLGKNNVSGVLTNKGLKLIIAKIRGGLEQAKNALVLAPPDAAEIAGSVVSGLENFVKDVESDVTVLAGGLRLDKAGNLHLSSRALFVKDSGFARAGGEVKAPEGGPLAGLPSRPFALAVGGSFPESAMKAMMSFSSQMMKLTMKDVPAEKLKQLEAAYAMLAKGMRSSAIMIGAPKEGAGLFSNIIAIMKVDDAPAYLTRQEKSIKAISDAMKGANVPFAPPMHVKRLKIDGRPALESVTDFGETQGIDELQKKIIEGLFGGKLTATVVAVDDATILTRYTSPAGMKKLLASIKTQGDLASSGAVMKITAMLPKGAQWEGFISPHGVMDIVKRIAEKAPNPPALPEMGKSPPVGFAVRITPGGLEGDMVVPSQALQAVTQFVQKARRAQDQ
jgi:hypothetical protein